MASTAATRTSPQPMAKKKSWKIARVRPRAARVSPPPRARKTPAPRASRPPPASAKPQKAAPAALDGYASLHRAALQILAPGGILATASCSARVTAQEFVGAVREAAQKTHADLIVLEEKRQPPDHPVLLAFPEGKYLKFFVFRKE